MPSFSPSSFDDADHGIADDAFAFATHRIDSPHTVNVERPPRERIKSADVAPQEALSGRVAEIDSPVIVESPEFASSESANSVTASVFNVDPQSLREAHEDDLILFLQQWSEDLDQRASRLHADIATQERRERAFRMWMQNQRAEWEAKINECERMQRHAEATARRLAFSG